MDDHVVYSFAMKVCLGMKTLKRSLLCVKTRAPFQTRQHGDLMYGA